MVADTPHDVREAMLRDYDRAAATHPRACAVRVRDASGRFVALTARQVRNRKTAEWVSGRLAPLL
ncbi:hypothetical protein SAMN02800694_3074 [Luteibacter sp. UNCMF331Sha3.1]|uniref:hypothetical protein n=1 Tax=Luteibacter sp. UNCMF331Sha3.1 TaxID=1502760 RepID=UPI0008D2D9EA|nr:hypothetical protein [Luteibacter sp. UNCMF331Sha3.1]SEN19977.1 hypothetical protein SAMN02800694_3074 [Luteibacter sp. UNCMF331Sha3.1]